MQRKLVNYLGFFTETFLNTRTGGDGTNCPEVEARLFMLDKQFRAAEEVYLQSGDVSSAIKMYEQFCMYEEGTNNCCTI
jgi:hypothetical protein